MRFPLMLDCYVINLDRAAERWSRIEREFAASQTTSHAALRLIRVPAVDGRALAPPYPGFAPWRFILKIGRHINPREIGCYLSHLRALEAFLASGQDYAMICEDDIALTPETVDVVAAALDDNARATWDLLRVHGARERSSITYRHLHSNDHCDYHLATTFTGFIYASAYIVNRAAATRLIATLRPMTLPYDIAIFSGRCGICEASIIPSPMQFSEQAAASCIDHSREFRLPLWHPCRLTAIAYRLYARTVKYSLATLRSWQRIHQGKRGD